MSDDFQKPTAPTIFVRFQPYFMINMLKMKEYQLLLFGQIALWHFEIFVNTVQYGAGNFTMLLLLQCSSYPGKLYENIGYHGRIQAIIFLDNQPFFLICGTLKF